MSNRFSFAALFLSLTACASVEPGRLYHPDMTPLNESELASLRTERMQLLTKRAAFDLSCDPEKLEVAGISSDVNGLCVTAGAKGCGAQGSYVWLKTDNGQSQWSLDSSTAAATKR